MGQARAAPDPPHHGAVRPAPTRRRLPSGIGGRLLAHGGAMVTIARPHSQPAAPGFIAGPLSNASTGETALLYKFKSQATADVIMLRDSAEEILKIVGKDPGATGIITVAQIPGAVAALKAEIERRETAPAQAPQAAGDDAAKEGDADKVQDEPIALRRRAAPFIDMLERSAAAGKDVVWGV